MLVAHVLVAEPRRLGDPLAHDPRRVVGLGVVRVREPERHEDRGRVRGAHRGFERVDGLVGADPVRPLEVLVLDEVQPDRRRVELARARPGPRPCGDREHVVARPEARDLSQWVGGSGYVRRRARVHRDDGRVRMRGEQPSAPEHRVVEVRRDRRRSARAPPGRPGPSRASRSRRSVPSGHAAQIGTPVATRGRRGVLAPPRSRGCPACLAPAVGHDGRVRTSDEVTTGDASRGRRASGPATSSGRAGGRSSCSASSPASRAGSRPRRSPGRSAPRPRTRATRSATGGPDRGDLRHPGR